MSRNLKIFALFVMGLVVLEACQNKSDKNRAPQPFKTTGHSSKIEKPTPPKSRLEKQMERLGLVDVRTMDSSIRMDLHYASADNFTHSVLYDTLRTIYLPLSNARKLLRAQKFLKKENPELRLIVWDAARPLSVQRKMYNKVSHTRYAAYVAKPNRSGLHNYGCAVDLSICDKNGKLLDMGTPFDYFGATAGIRDEAGFVRKGMLTQKQVDNRKLLRKVMMAVGFRPILGEWWHFNTCPLYEARKRFPLIE